MRKQRDGICDLCGRDAVGPVLGPLRMCRTCADALPLEYERRRVARVEGAVGAFYRNNVKRDGRNHGNH